MKKNTPVDRQRCFFVVFVAIVYWAPRVCRDPWAECCSERNPCWLRPWLLASARPVDPPGWLCTQRLCVLGLHKKVKLWQFWVKLWHIRVKLWHVRDTSPLRENLRVFYLGCVREWLGQCEGCGWIREKLVVMFRLGDARWVCGGRTCRLLIPVEFTYVNEKKII